MHNRYDGVSRVLLLTDRVLDRRTNPFPFLRSRVITLKTRYESVLTRRETEKLLHWNHTSITTRGPGRIAAKTPRPRGILELASRICPATSSRPHPARLSPPFALWRNTRVRNANGPQAYVRTRLRITVPWNFFPPDRGGPGATRADNKFHTVRTRSEFGPFLRSKLRPANANSVRSLGAGLAVEERRCSFDRLSPEKLRERVSTFLCATTPRSVCATFFAAKLGAAKSRVEYRFRVSQIGLALWYHKIRVRKFD